MDLLKGEFGSSNETCASSAVNGNEINDIEAEMVSNMTEEEEGLLRTVPVIKTEPEVSVVVSVMDISCRLCPELPVPIPVGPCETNMSL